MPTSRIQWTARLDSDTSKFARTLSIRPCVMRSRSDKKSSSAYGEMCMVVKTSSGTFGMNCRISVAPAWMKRNPVPEYRALPPHSGSGAFSSMTTRSAPAFRAETAASNAALPAPITITSQCSFVLNLTRGAPSDGHVHQISPALGCRRFSRSGRSDPKIAAHDGSGLRLY